MEQAAGNLFGFEVFSNSDSIASIFVATCAYSAGTRSSFTLKPIRSLSGPEGMTQSVVLGFPAHRALAT
jgi:hypothetical protein